LSQTKKSDRDKSTSSKKGKNDDDSSSTSDIVDQILEEQKNGTIHGWRSTLLSKVVHPGKVKRRFSFSNISRRAKWTPQEEENLARGVAVYGVGNWAAILNAYKFDPKRTTISLKDKWRNMVKLIERGGSEKPQLEFLKVPISPKDENEHKHDTKNGEDSEDFIRN